MLEHVGQAFLDDPVSGQVQPARECGQVAVGDQADLDSRLADLGDQVGEFCQARLGARDSSSPLLRSRPSRRRSSGHGLPPGLFDRVEIATARARNSPDRPYTSSAAAHMARPPAAIRRFT